MPICKTIDRQKGWGGGGKGDVREGRRYNYLVPCRSNILIE